MIGALERITFNLWWYFRCRTEALDHYGWGGDAWIDR